MKKFIAVIGFVMVAIFVCAPTLESEAQPAMSLRCCDGYGNIRCSLENWTPIGNPCFCYGQGWGYTC